jgi:hypothetical protein
VIVPDQTRTLVSALVEIARKQLTGVSEVAVDGGKIRVIWSGGIPVAADEIGVTQAARARDPREKNRLALLSCLRWQPVADQLTFRESADSLRGVPQNPVALGPLIVASARHGFGPGDAVNFIAAHEKSCPQLAIAAADLVQRLELRPNEAKLLELLDGTALLRTVLARCELDELHSVQLLAVLQVLELVRWGPLRQSIRADASAAVVVPRHTPMSRPDVQPVRVTPVTASKTPSAPGETRISITPPTPSTPSPPPISSPAPVSRSTTTPGSPQRGMTPVVRPTMTPTSRPTATPVVRPTFTPTSRPLGSSPISSPPGSGPPLSGRSTPRSLPPGASSQPPMSSAEARVEAAEVYKQAKTALSMGQTKQAQELFSRAAALAPEVYEYLLQESLLEYLSAKVEADRERLTKRLEGLVVRALTKDRKLAIAHRVRGYLALAAGQDDPALKAFKMAKDLDPEDMDSQRHYLVLMRRKKR